MAFEGESDQVHLLSFIGNLHALLTNFPAESANILGNEVESQRTRFRETFNRRLLGRVDLSDAEQQQLENINLGYDVMILATERLRALVSRRQDSTVR